MPDNPRVRIRAEARQALAKFVLSWDGPKTSSDFLAAFAVEAEKYRAAVKRDDPVALKTVMRWIAERLPRGNVGFASKVREDRKHPRALKEWMKAFSIAKSVGSADAGTLSVAAIWRELRNECEKRGELEDLPSCGVIRKYLRDRLRPDIPILAREGKQEYGLKALPRIVRDTTRMRANDWWIMDHRIHDAFAFNAIFPSNVLPLLKMYRPWMSLTWDWASTKIIGVVWAPTPSSRTITASLRMAVAQFGLPRNFYWDNGKDYQKVGRVMMAEDVGAILKGNSVVTDWTRVEVTNALPYNPMSKAIEPFFQNIAYGFDQKLGVAYTGNDPNHCSGRCREAQKQHKDFVEGRGRGRATPFRSDRDFIMAAAQEIDEYNARGQSRFGGRSPNEVFDEQCPPDSRRMVDRRILDQLFHERDTRTVKQGGCVELNNLRYEPADDQSFAVLCAKWRPRDSEEVLIARDAWDLGTAVAFDISTGEFLGDLQIQQAVEQSAHGRLSVDGIRANARRKKALYRSAALYLASVDAMAEASNWKSSFDALLERAGVAATGTDGRAITRNAPGAGVGLPAMAEPRRITAGSPFISDAAKEDAAMFAEFARPKRGDTE